MPFFLPAIGALVGGVTSAIEGQQNVNQANQNIDIAQNTLRSSMINDKELNDLLLSNDRFYTSNLSNLMNSTAITNRGVANSGVVGAAVASNLVGKEGEADLQIRQKAAEQNLSLTDRIAQLQTQRKSTSVVGDFFSGAVGGLTAGMEADKFFSSSDTTQLLPYNPASPSSRLGNFVPPSLLGSSGLNKYQLNSPPNPFGGKVSNPFVDYLGNGQTQYDNFSMINFN